MMVLVPPSSAAKDRGMSSCFSSILALVAQVSTMGSRMQTTGLRCTAGAGGAFKPSWAAEFPEYVQGGQQSAGATPLRGAYGRAVGCGAHVLLTNEENSDVATTMRTSATELLRGVPSTCGSGHGARSVRGAM